MNTNKKLTLKDAVPTHLAVSAFQEFLLSEGFGKVDIKADGQIHRFRVEGQRKGSSNGYYGFCYE